MKSTTSSPTGYRKEMQDACGYAIASNSRYDGGFLLALADIGVGLIKFAGIIALGIGIALYAFA